MNVDMKIKSGREVGVGDLPQCIGNFFSENHEKIMHIKIYF